MTAPAETVPPAVDDATWLVAVDDDPTGSQSVSGVPIVTTWDVETLVSVASIRAPVTFVLTNTRSLQRDQAIRINEEVGANLAAAAARVGLSLRVLSRGDSTLRGHNIDEVEALARGTDARVDGVVVCPCFFEAGRFTLEGVQWVLQHGELIAARDTEFAADRTFGYHELLLRDWVSARTSSTRQAAEVSAVQLAKGDGASVQALLRSAADGQAIIVNAANYAQLGVFVAALEAVEAEGRHFIYRSGPSFVRARAKLGEPLQVDFGTWAPTPGGGHGLVIVGSHTTLTNHQVQHATEHDPTLRLVELVADAVVDPQRAADHITEAAESVAALLANRTVIVHTSRRLTGKGGDGALRTGVAISNALVEITERVSRQQPPDWVVAKGGITSHELLTRAFRVKRAMVAGQALPGLVTVLEIPGTPRPWPFLIFPGNVGSPSSLTDVLDRIKGAP